MARTIAITITGNALDAVRALRRTADEAQKTNRSLKNLTTTTNVFATVSKVAASRATLMAGGIAAAVPAALALVKALSPLVGLLVALPGAAVAAGAAIGVVKLITAGVGDAISAGLAGDAKAFEAALAKIPPAARRFAQEVVSLRRPFNALRATVSNAFFEQFNGQVKDVATRWLPAIQQGFKQIAAAAGRFASGFLKVLNNKGVVDAFGRTFRGLAQAIDLARPGILALGRALLLMVDLVAPVLRQLGKYVNSVAKTFANWLDTNRRSGRMAVWLGNALKAVRQIYSITNSVVRIFGALFRASGGQTLLSTIEQLTKKLAAFLNSTRGQRLLKEFFEGAKEVGRAALELFKKLVPVVKDLYEAIKPSIPVLLELARQFSREIIPLVKDLGKWLKDNKDTIAEWLPLLAKVYVAVRIIKFGKMLSDALLISAALRGIFTIVSGAVAASAAGAAAGAAFRAGLLAALGGALRVVGGLLIVDIALRLVFDTSLWKEVKGLWDEAPWTSGSKSNQELKAFANWFGTTLPNLFRAPDIKASGWSGFVEGIQKEVGRLERWFSHTLPDAINLGSGSGWSGLAQDFTDFWRKLFGRGEQIIQNFFRFGANIATALGRGIQQGWNAIRDSIPNILRGPTGQSTSPTATTTAATTAWRGVAAPAPMVGGFGGGGGALNVNINLAPGTSSADVERQLVQILDSYQRRTGRKVLVTT